MLKFFDRELGKKYKDGEIIFQQGDPADALFVIQKGRVEILLRSEVGEQRLNLFEEGETFGETSLFAGKARFTTARALGPARILRIDKRTFMTMIHRDQSLAYRIIRQLAQRVYELDHEFIRNSYEQQFLCDLTGLPKFPDASKLLEGEVRRAKMMMQSLAFAVIDLDFAGNLQNEHGPEVLQQVLKSITDLLLKHLRKTDFIGRYGRDHFPVILYEADASSAFRVIDNVRAEFSRIPFPSEGKSFNATVSAGIATFPRRSSAEELRQAALAALRQAKEKGRNLTILADELVAPPEETATPEEKPTDEAVSWMRRHSLDIFRLGRKKKGN